MRYVLGSCVLAATTLCSPAFAQSSPVVGDWAVVVETPQGNFETTMMVEEEAGAYSVSFDDPPNPNFPPPESDEITNVVVEGGSFSFTRTLSSPQGPFELSYSGMVDGDSLTGEANSAFGPVPITATRK